MKTKSLKAKARLHQQEVRDRLLRAFPSLTEEDIQSVTMGRKGEDIIMS